MASSRIVEAVDVFEDRHFSLSARFPCVPPNQFGFDGFEEGLDGGVIVTITLAAHPLPGSGLLANHETGDLEAMLAQDLLVIVRTILTATVGMMDAALGRRSECYGHVQSPDRQVTLHPIADGPTNDWPRMKVQDHSKIQPAFPGPDIGNVTSPLLVWLFC